MKLNKNRVKEWTQEHKKELVIAGASAGITIAGVVILKQNPAVVKKSLISARRITAKTAKAIPDNTITKAVEVAKTARLGNGIDWERALKMRTGNYFSAAKLGKRVGLSAQKFNKRLVDFGLAHRTPNGTLFPTEMGNNFYALTGKETPWGSDVIFHSWDEGVINIIFSKKELEEIATRMKMVKEAVNSVA